VRGGEFVNLLAITGYSLNLSNGRVFTDMTIFTEKPDGIVEINVAPLLTESDIGSHKAFLLTFDPVNTSGVRWPDFKLKVKA
jgi:hypothetical protein